MNMESPQVVMVRPLKWVTFHGLGTSYRTCLWKFSGDNELLRKSGYRDVDYIAMIVWTDRPTLVVDDEGGAPFWAIKEAGLGECPVLEKGWEMALKHFDRIPSVCNIEVSRVGDDFDVKIEGSWKF
jgi:hypothetical protein